MFYISYSNCFLVVFRQPLSLVMRKTNGAVKMLQEWKTSYLETRMRIEASARTHRWEFDKRKLFAETDYLASVANNLNNVANVCTVLFFHLLGSLL